MLKFLLMGEVVGQINLSNALTSARPTASEQAKIPVLTVKTLSLKVLFIVNASFAQSLEREAFKRFFRDRRGLPSR